MSATGTSGTAKWVLSNGTLTISPVSGTDGYLYFDDTAAGWLSNNGKVMMSYLTLSDEEVASITAIVFTGHIRFKYTQAGIISGTVTQWLTSYDYLFGKGVSNNVSFRSYVTYIDVTGLDSTDVVSFANMFRDIKYLTTIVGLNTLNTSSVYDYAYMFKNTALTSIDFSSFQNMNIESAGSSTASLSSYVSIHEIIDEMYYCTSITFPSDFHRTSTQNTDLPSNSTLIYNIGIAGTQGYSELINGQYISYYYDISATNVSTGVTVLTDKDFMSLPSGQGGTWVREIIPRHGSYQSEFSISISSCVREIDTVTIRFSYRTESNATASMYVKPSSASSYPTTAQETLPFTQGSGTYFFTYNCPTDDAYDFQIIFTNGTKNIYCFASADSNILLFGVGPKGQLRNLLDVNSDASSSAAATSGLDMDLFNLIRTKNWYSEVMVDDKTVDIKKLLKKIIQNL